MLHMRRIHGFRTGRFALPCLVPLATTLAVLLAMSGCSGSSSATVNLSKLYWVLSQKDLAFIQTADPKIAGHILAGPSPFVLAQPFTGPAKPVPHGAVPTLLFTSYSAFSSSVRNGAIHTGIRAVEYDPEFWSATPQEDQQDPLSYMALFAREARRSRYQAILAPGRDLVLTPGGKCAERQGETINPAYLRCDIPRAAQFTPVFVIQCAPIELDLPELRSFVAASAHQARAANPSAVLIATLSTRPGGASATATDMVRAANAILPFVGGFQLNTTSATRGIAVDFLRAISGTGQR